MTHLDTQILVWLYIRQERRIPLAARQLLEDADLAISPMVELELTYLHEIGRLRVPAAEVLDELRATFEIAFSSAPFGAVVRQAVSLTWTRDPFDRLIVAQALVDRVSLLTADATIRANVPTVTIWN